MGIQYHKTKAMNKIVMFSFLLWATTTNAQEFSNPTRTETKDDAGLQGSKSGFFETEHPVNYPAGANQWWHLLDVRHTNPADNYAMQFAGSFYDQNLFFRKTANNVSQSWSRVILEGADGVAQANSFRAYNDDFSGNNYAVGNDTYLGDINESFTASLMGQGDRTQGWLRMGKDAPGGGTKIGSDPNGNFIIQCNGNVGIGTLTPREALSVNGNIRAKEVKVESTNWPDYVFSPSYNLPSLSETAQYIRENGHLPNMPTATQVEKDGVNLGEMNKKLLEKVEELTLHLIRLQNEVDRLSNKDKQ